MVEFFSVFNHSPGKSIIFSMTLCMCNFDIDITILPAGLGLPVFGLQVGFRSATVISKYNASAILSLGIGYWYGVPFHSSWCTYYWYRTLIQQPFSTRPPPCLSRVLELTTRNRWTVNCFFVCYLHGLPPPRRVRLEWNYTVSIALYGLQRAQNTSLPSRAPL